MSLAIITIASVAQAAQFTVNTTLANYRDHGVACAQQGGYLASIHSEEENTQLIALLRAASASVNRPTAVYYIGAHYEGGDWEWADGTLFDYYSRNNDGIRGTSENKIAIRANTGQWNDWQNGAGMLYAACRTFVPTAAPTGPTPPPTRPAPSRSPSVAPTFFYQHPQHANDIDTLQSQVNGLGSTSASSRGDINALLSRMDAVEAAQTSTATSMNTLQNTVQQMRGAINAAVTSFQTTNGNYDFGYSVCTGSNCESPSVEANGGLLKVKSNDGTVVFDTDQCGEINPCQTATTADAVVSAFAQLRNI